MDLTFTTTQPERCNQELPHFPRFPSSSDLSLNLLPPVDAPEEDMRTGNGSSDVTADTRSTAALAIQAASITVIILGSTLGNLLILLSIYLNKSLRNKTAIFIANLAIADFINGSIAMPFILMCTVTNYWPLSSTWCSFQAALSIMLCAVSIGTLGSIAYERYAAIVHPLRYHDQVTKSKIGFLISWIWVQAVVLSICPLLGWSEYMYLHYDYLCTANWGLDVSYTFSVIGFYFTAPLSVMGYCYARIFIVARRHSRQIATLTISSRQDNNPDGAGDENKNQRRSVFNTKSLEQFKKDAKSAFMLLIVMALFVVCWTPHGFTMFWAAIDKDDFPDITYTITTWLAMSNSMFNPLIYGFLNRQYRNTFYVILFPRFCKATQKSQRQSFVRSSSVDTNTDVCRSRRTTELSMVDLSDDMNISEDVNTHQRTTMTSQNDVHKPNVKGQSRTSEKIKVAWTPNIAQNGGTSEDAIVISQTADENEND